MDMTAERRFSKEQGEQVEKRSADDSQIKPQPVVQLVIFMPAYHSTENQ